MIVESSLGIGFVDRRIKHDKQMIANIVFIRHFSL